MRLIVLKIGGSCLTYKKEGLPRIRSGFLRRLSREVRSSLNHSKISLVIVHGGGSITHPLLDKYKLAKKLKTGKISNHNDKIGAAKIHLSMNFLNKKIVQSLIDNDLPAWPIQTSAIVFQSQRKLKEVFIKSLKTAIDQEYIPVLHGDLAVDEKTSASIISGDILACYLAKKLDAQKIVFASDIKGVFTNDPKTDKKATFIEEIDTINSLQKIKTGKAKDHSGGMKGKLESIEKFCHGIKVVVMDGRKNKNIENSLKGKERGTIIKI